ncbi:hypothetical protein CL656_04805 [bacterium]|nr:hypothetical protein [bacterium]|tara:strand:- start:1 stop:252 length:252 start_codon:yes stop_codon:yes gene_type:complete
MAAAQEKSEQPEVETIELSELPTTEPDINLNLDDNSSDKKGGVGFLDLLYFVFFRLVDLLYSRFFDVVNDINTLYKESLDKLN